jgi:hypothetical protein
MASFIFISSHYPLNTAGTAYQKPLLIPIVDIVWLEVILRNGLLELFFVSQSPKNREETQYSNIELFKQSWVFG